MFDDGCPEGWDYAYIDTGANVSFAFNLPPDLNEENITVKAQLPWQ